MANKKKQSEDTEQTVVESLVNIYVIDERNGGCILILNNVDLPNKDDHIILYKDGYGFEVMVTKRTLLIDAASENMAWNLYVIPIGQPWKLPTPDDGEDEQKKSKGKKKVKTSTDELLN